MSEDCIFCKIAKKEIPTDFIYEDENVAAFRDLNPQAPVHVLVIPKEHYSSIREVTDKEVFAHLMYGVQKTAEKLNIKEFRTVINTGASAGQSVFHIHVHILAGRDLLWPPG